MEWGLAALHVGHQSLDYLCRALVADTQSAKIMPCKGQSFAIRQVASIPPV
jgi:hypothetical protein